MSIIGKPIDPEYLKIVLPAAVPDSVKKNKSILGQSDYKTTMDRYVHPREDKKQEAIKKVGLMLQS